MHKNTNEEDETTTTSTITTTTTTTTPTEKKLTSSWNLKKRPLKLAVPSALSSHLYRTTTATSHSNKSIARSSHNNNNDNNNATSLSISPSPNQKHHRQHQHNHKPQRRQYIQKFIVYLSGVAVCVILGRIGGNFWILNRPSTSSSIINNHPSEEENSLYSYLLFITNKDTNQNIMDRRILDAALVYPSLNVNHTVSTTRSAAARPTSPLLSLRRRRPENVTQQPYDTDDWATTTQHQYRKNNTQRQNERRHRTRPPSFASNNEAHVLEPQPTRWTPTATTATAVVPITAVRSPKPSNDKNTEQENARPWRALCEAAGLSSSSRVTLVYALTSTTGPALALLLHRHCGVTHVTALDHTAPSKNDSKTTTSSTSRRDVLRLLRHLFRNIPQFQAKILGHDEDDDDWFSFSSSSNTSPTHVIYFQSPSSQRASDREQQSLERLLAFSYSSPPSLLYISDTMSHAPHAHPPHPDDTILHTLAIQRRRILAETLFSLSNGTVALQELELPPVYGPLVGNDNYRVTRAATDYDNKLDLDDALAVILSAMNRSRSIGGRGMHRMTVENGSSNRALPSPSVQSVPLRFAAANNSTDSETSVNDHGREWLQTTSFRLDQEYPFGFQQDRLSHSHKKNHHPIYPHGANDAARQVRELYGIHQTRFPCASSCHGPTSSPACEPTVLDAIVPVSVAATTGCDFVVYLVDFGKDVNELFKPTAAKGEDICRVAFVSGQSPVVQRAIHSSKFSPPAVSMKDTLQRHNGKLKSNGWTLIWLLTQDDESTLSDAALVLAIVDPVKLFAPSVEKAMFSATASFSEPSDAAIRRILSRVDRPAWPAHMRKEHRSGIVLSRFVEHPAEPARSVLFFASETPEVLQPKSLSAYVKLAVAENVSIPKQQVRYYKHLSRLIEAESSRQDDDLPTTMYKTFPFQWISLGLIIHDLKYEKARTLRCSWYDEYLYWGHSNRGAEELSLAYVIGMERLLGNLGPGHADDPSWVPIQDQHGRPLSTLRGHEAFLRLMKPAHSKNS